MLRSRSQLSSTKGRPGNLQWVTEVVPSLFTWRGTIVLEQELSTTSYSTATDLSQSNLLFFTSIFARNSLVSNPPPFTQHQAILHSQPSNLGSVDQILLEALLIGFLTGIPIVSKVIHDILISFDPLLIAFPHLTLFLLTLKFYATESVGSRR